MIRIGLNIIIILLFLSHCGYTPIYSKLNTQDLNINILNVSGDIDIKNLFARELEAIAKPNDIFIAISTSGNSTNIIKAIEKSIDLKLRFFILTGSSGG